MGQTVYQMYRLKCPCQRPTPSLPPAWLFNPVRRKCCYLKPQQSSSSSAATVVGISTTKNVRLREVPVGCQAVNQRGNFVHRSVLGKVQPASSVAATAAVVAAVKVPAKCQAMRQQCVGERRIHGAGGRERRRRRRRDREWRLASMLERDNLTGAVTSHQLVTT